MSEQSDILRRRIPQASLIMAMTTQADDLLANPGKPQSANAWEALPEAARHEALLRRKHGPDNGDKVRAALANIDRADRAERDKTMAWFARTGKPASEDVVARNGKAAAQYRAQYELGLNPNEYAVQMEYGGRATPEAPPARADSMSLGEQVDRWYRHTGGVFGAIRASERAQRTNDANRVLDRSVWLPVRREEVRKPRTVRYGDGAAYSGTQKNVRGFWDPSTDIVSIVRTQDDPSTLDHELTHAVTGQGGAIAQQLRAAARDSEKPWNPPARDSNQRYWSDPLEVDARLADIKRRYAFYTGKLVTTPEEAREAWEWWRANGDTIGRSASGESSIGGAEFDYYDELPDRHREQLFLRMPELVRGPLLSGLRAG